MFVSIRGNHIQDFFMIVAAVWQRSCYLNVSLTTYRIRRVDIIVARQDS